MRITIESTHSPPEHSAKCSVEVPSDDITLSEVVLLVKGALLGYGFVPENVEDWFPGATPEEIEIHKSAGDLSQELNE